jgi:hypothetical protein
MIRKILSLFNAKARTRARDDKRRAEALRRDGYYGEFRRGGRVQRVDLGKLS